MTAICETCGATFEMGEWPFCPHGKVEASSPMRNKPFVPYYDDGLGAKVNSHSERLALMRKNNLDYRDRTAKPGCEV